MRGIPPTFIALAFLIAAQPATPAFAQSARDCGAVEARDSDTFSKAVHAIGGFFRNQASNAIFRLYTLPVNSKAKMTSEQKATVESLEPTMGRSRYVGERFIPLYAAKKGNSLAVSSHSGLIENLEELRAK